MAIHVEISPCVDGQVEQRVPGEGFEHMIEEADTGLYPRLARPIEIYPNVEIGLLRRAADLRNSGHGQLLTGMISPSALMTASISSSVPTEIRTHSDSCAESETSRMRIP